MSELKTKYRFIKFEKTSIDWICFNNRQNDYLGDVKYVAKWKEYEFVPRDNCGFTIQCLLDIADFLRQLNERKEK